MNYETMNSHKLINKQLFNLFGKYIASTIYCSLYIQCSPLIRQEATSSPEVTLPCSKRGLLMTVSPHEGHPSFIRPLPLCIRNGLIRGGLCVCCVCACISYRHLDIKKTCHLVSFWGKLGIPFFRVWSVHVFALFFCVSATRNVRAQSLRKIGFRRCIHASFITALSWQKLNVGMRGKTST